MKLLSCILFAGFALSANLVHAEGACRFSPNAKVGVDANDALKVLDVPSAGSTAPAPNGAGARR